MSIFKHAVAAAAASIMIMGLAGHATAGEAEIVSICSAGGSEGPQAIAAFVNEQRQSGQSSEQIDKALVSVTVALGCRADCRQDRQRRVRPARCRERQLDHPAARRRDDVPSREYSWNRSLEWPSGSPEFAPL
jgi:hypothetical protein